MSQANQWMFLVWSSRGLYSDSSPLKRLAYAYQIAQQCALKWRGGVGSKALSRAEAQHRWMGEASDILL